MKRNRGTFLTIIIPCYNEEENLKREVLKEVNDFLKKKKFTWEVIISDDGSTDKSREIVKRQIKKWRNFKLKANPHGGKPSAIWSGIKSAKGQYVLLTDMDQSTPIDQLDKLYTNIREGHDVIIGSRGFQRKNFPAYRKLGALIFMALRKSFLLPKINDTQCGFKLFKTDLVKKAFPKLEFFRNRKKVKGWMVTSYDVELLHVLNKMPTDIKEVQVEWNDKDVSVSKGRAFGRYLHESKEMLGQILRVKINDTRGLYD